MRKLILAVGVVGLLSIGVAGVAQGARTSRASNKRCGTTYTATCHKPQVSSKSPPLQCVKAGVGFKLPTITFVSNAGIKKIKLELIPPKLLKLLKFKGEGKTQYRLKGVLIKTAGLQTGAHHVKVTVTDVRGKTATKLLRFTVCAKPAKATKPVFTG